MLAFLVMPNLILSALVLFQVSSGVPSTEVATETKKVLAPANSAESSPAPVRPQFSTLEPTERVASVGNERTDTVWAVTATAWATIAQSAFSALALIGLLATWREAKRAADAAREQIDNMDRPYIIPVRATLEFNVVSEDSGWVIHYGAELQVHNFGRAPAEVKNIIGFFSTDDLGEKTEEMLIADLGQVYGADSSFETGTKLMEQQSLERDAFKKIGPIASSVERFFHGAIHYTNPYTGVEYLRVFSYRQKGRQAAETQFGIQANYDRRIKISEKHNTRALVRELSKANFEAEIPIIDPAELKAESNLASRLRSLKRLVIRRR